MIVKHVPMRSLGKSDFAGLVNYVTDAQSKDHRLGQVQLTNCEAASVQDAITEVLATQHINTRAKGDKTYHLIVSFRAGEQPDAETLRAIEERISTALGYGEHQRVSAVHNDTDNLHIHIAINKIHPMRHTMHEPYYPHKTLAELCPVLEHDYSLERDNHEPRQRGAEGRAVDMERHAGIESLIGWIKRECLDEIKGAQTWQALHQVMHDNGLELRERANGLVIEAGDGTMVKASTLARELSKPKLEARLGSFEASPERQKRTKAKRQYQKNPVRMRVNTTELYAKYRGDQQTLASAQRAALEKAKQHKARKIEQAKKSSRLRRAVIKLMGDGRFAKKLLYAQAHHALRTEIDSINKRYQKDRQNCYDKHKRRTWADWLKKEALQGNSEALAALRSREAAQTLKGNTMQGKGKAKPARAPEVDNITKKGTIIFRAGKTAVRDDGNRLQVSREATREGLQEALRMAMQRYGPRITVTGTVEFKAQIIRAAVDSRLPISFADPALESRRQALLNKESIHARQDGQDRGRTGRGPSDAGRRPVAHDNTARLNAATRTGSGRGVASGSANYGKRKTNIGRIGRNPPQKNQHHLRTLSQLGVVQIGGGSEVLLPRDVRDHVEQQGTKPTHELRRDIHRSGSGVKHKPEQLAAMDKYIAEREDKRLKGFDIMKHSRYTAGGELTFAGTRKVDGQMLALLKRNDEILVLPIDGQTERKMKRIAIGEEVSIQKGAIKTKGKSR